MNEVKVWDLPTRIFHWTLLAAVGLGYVMSSGRPTGLTFLVHVACGYLVLLLLLFRLAWGFIGGEHALFAGFVRGPAAVWDHLKGLRRGGAGRFIGHNPAAGAMIVLLLVTLVLIVVTGLLAQGVTGGSGPLSALVPLATARAIGAIHQWLGNAILVLAGLHVLGVIVESVLQRENLAQAMVTGRKPVRGPGDRDARRVPARRVVVLCALLAALALALAATTRIPWPAA